MNGYVCRRDLQGLIHYAVPPSPYQHTKGVVSTSARCDWNINTYGDYNVPQDGPTCLWCVVEDSK